MPIDTSQRAARKPGSNYNDKNDAIIISSSLGSCLVPLSPRCRDCIGVYSITNQQVECLTLPASRFETNYGLMLLSTKELNNSVASGFNPQSQFRGYLATSVCGTAIQGGSTYSIISGFFAMFYRWMVLGTWYVLISHQRAQQTCMVNKYFCRILRVASTMVAKNVKQVPIIIIGAPNSIINPFRVSIV